MKNFEIKRQLTKIQNLIKSTTDSTKDNLELQSHWAKYICIIIAGFLENSIAELYKDFTKSCSPPFIHNHVSHYLSKIQNPKHTKFIEVAKSFKPEWGIQLESYFQENGRSEAIGNIMKNRHLVAHGKDSQITLTKVKEYLEKSIEILDFIETQCNTKPSVTEVS